MMNGVWFVALPLVFRSLGLDLVVLDWLSLDKVPDAPAGGREFDRSVYIKARCHSMHV